MCFAWGGEPHLIIARIAQKMLSPAQQEWMENIMAVWPSEKQTMVQSSNWQDTLRSDVGDIFLEWHFSDIPIVEPGFESHVPNAHFNITNAIEDEVNSILDKSTTSLWSIAFNLRNLIHFVGDSHCPVHAVTHFSEDHPDGDQGANDVILDCAQYGYYCANLHKVWDAAVLNYQTPKGRAESMPDFESNITRVEAIARAAPFNESILDLSPYQWVKESHQIAVDYVYDQYFEPKLNDRYIADGNKQSDIRISLAGNRLGLILQKFFETRTDLFDVQSPILQTKKDSKSENPLFSLPSREMAVWIVDIFVFIVIIIYSAILLYRKRISSQLSTTPLITNSMETVEN